MANSVTLDAKTRTATGKGAARTLRREGKVPGVIYGHGREPEALALDVTALSKALVSVHGATIIDVTVDGRAPVKALIRELQRNPVRPGDVIHLDLYEVKADEKITVAVPVHLTGIPDGVRNSGGILDHSLRELNVEVYPGDIPASIDIDVTNLTIGHSIYVRDVTVEKVKILNDPNVPVCTVVAPRAEEVVAPVVGEEAVAVAEPELIRKPKDEDEEEPEGK
ncbi:MAG TPA: 50S ribosomal protein L25 [Gemmatimonadales bacterium]|jgi:large subunit ribosomal protein L25|nr:50S ribosomal protein L25 [Gemmatimonadales bacterium]